MRFFLDQLFRDQEPYLFSAADVLLAMTVSALLAYVIATVYRTTHRGTSYSQAYIHTLFLMAVATAVVMMIIGSNIARAFSLVGALSIIRFRTAVKDARDTGFLFTAMVAGMGCGTQFYMPAILFTVFISAMILLLHYSDFGRRSHPANIVRIRFEKGGERAEKIEAGIRQVFKNPRLLNRLSDFEDGYETKVYAVRAVRPEATADFESRMKSIPGVTQVAVYERDQVSDE